MTDMENTVILVTNNGMGRAEERLQQTLIGKYLELIAQNGNFPAAICFYTEGVRLVCEGSPMLGQLRGLESHLVRLIVCSTCLRYLGLEDKIQVGIVGGMGDILEAQVRADKVNTIPVFHESEQMPKQSPKTGCVRMPAPLFSGFSWQSRDLLNLMRSEERKWISI